jgi:2-polyprenyl-3-methyl-5-hydroxy-6-metoxy-1,4-benzoquinol methylase
MPATELLYGGRFEPDNLNNPRTLIANWVPAGSSVLEVGPGDGVISRWLKQTQGCHTVGVEVMAQARQAGQDVFDPLIIGSIEAPAVLEAVGAHAPFDAIVFADVLEHLVDPWQVLRNMRPLLAPAGRVLLSVPNVAHWSARWSLLFGSFEYTNGYLMDRTHLRWFTRRSARAMAGVAGYRILAEGVVYRPHLVRLLPTLMGYQFVLNLAPA